MDQHRTNRPITAQLEVHYSKNGKPGDSKIVGTLLRVQQHPDGVDDFEPLNACAFGEESQNPSLQTEISKNMKVCDLYQCVHSRHYHHHDDWFVHVPACARRFSESNLTRLPGHYLELREQQQGHHQNSIQRPASESTLSSPSLKCRSRRTASCSSAGLGFGSEVLPTLMESETSEFTPENPFRKHYSMENSVDNTSYSENTGSLTLADNQDNDDKQKTSNEYYDYNYDYDYNDEYNSNSPSESRSITEKQPVSPRNSMHACKIDFPTKCTEDDSSQCSLDLSSPCTNHHHRRNSLAVKFQKPRYRSV
ncbi:uncharacterized protein KLLA0_F06138g [Kluyveromyces lactis]|uniref:KLLA0F06138p n=1 Tax=Kluyveromyces lactis (strain ATCC 8585 / CBS 2359 / DSM 70799 / NBRC 1267 / NRRL Y-1140 / WM37) TaxID=284590 RepID=Q6CL31_KLULA|nr:uncharacterized protein KLLA0_F06138g [Kluyveromyces lactis]CAG98066.1 KLLA0F06138p [Kluyveromyces lactis]|eukprot:XP_455358.1 uncharacterized protein KLLA0_F06138g [Kluyveromyces lactis]